MMLYAVSDLHGCSANIFLSLLDKISFSKMDSLFILGDVIDYNYYGIELLYIIMKNPNMKLIRGNHESMLLECSYLFADNILTECHNISKGNNAALSCWLSHGALPTYNQMLSLPAIKQKQIINYLYYTPLYQIILLNKRKLILTHSGLNNFNPKRDISNYENNDYLWNRTHITDSYFNDNKTIIVMGHTPTYYICDNCYGKPFFKYQNELLDWIDIDVGAGKTTSISPVILRLDDMKYIALQYENWR